MYYHFIPLPALHEFAHAPLHPPVQLPVHPDAHAPLQVLWQELQQEPEHPH